jgi:hypothetical protein
MCTNQCFGEDLVQGNEAMRIVTISSNLNDYRPNYRSIRNVPYGIYYDHGGAITIITPDRDTRIATRLSKHSPSWATAVALVAMLLRAAQVP